MTEPAEQSQLGALRKRIRVARRSLPEATRSQANRALCERVAALDVFRAAASVAAFLPFDGEVDLTPLIELLAAGGKTVYLPVMLGRDDPLRFAAYHRNDILVHNQFGIAEPEVPPATTIEPPALALVLAPLVAFDPGCNRLGVGGGYYDRTFAFVNQGQSDPWNRPFLLGTAFELQKTESLPVRPWDVRLDAVATESALYQRQPSATANRHQ